MKNQTSFSSVVGGLTLLGAALALMFVARSGKPTAAKEMAPAGKQPLTKVEVPVGREVATFAAGCFWSMEAIFKQLKGVDSALPGYAGGRVPNPSYEQVENGDTGHAETINIVFDPKVISYRELLQVLLTVRNPTTLNKQGPDEGPQYRSVIFTHSAAQEKDAKAAIAEMAAAKVWPDPIVTKVESFTNFYRAEDYHLDYYNQHSDEPYCRLVIAPEIREFQEKFRNKLKNKP